MFVSKREINVWRLRYEHGDFKEMEKISGSQSSQLSRALRNTAKTGRMAEKTYYIFHDYFQNKKIV